MAELLPHLGYQDVHRSINFQQSWTDKENVGAALTLDEFALWLNLEPNDYWNREGRLSVDAVILFGAILATGAWGAPFFRGLARMWSKRKVVGRGLSFPIRHVRLLRPRRLRRRPPHSAQQ